MKLKDFLIKCMKCLNTNGSVTHSLHFGYDQNYKRSICLYIRFECFDCKRSELIYREYDEKN